MSDEHERRAWLINHQRRRWAEREAYRRVHLMDERREQAERDALARRGEARADSGYVHESSEAQYGSCGHCVGGSVDGGLGRCSYCGGSGWVEV